MTNETTGFALDDYHLEDDSRPLRGDSYSAEHLEQLFRELAASQTTVPGRGVASKAFAQRFEKHAVEIALAHSLVSRAATTGTAVPSEAEWLLDNYYVVEEQLREIRDDLPRGYYKELPKTTDGRPRVYQLARQLVIHTDSSMDAPLIERCVQSFQQVTPLQIGEVWAVPIMLRLVLVENLHRLCKQMLITYHCRQRAHTMLQCSDGSKPWELELCDDPHCAPTVVQLLEQVPEYGNEHRETTQRLEQRITDHGWQMEDVVRHEHHRQAANQVSIGNVITSMRLIATLDWIEFFEHVNVAEQILREDPAGVYADMHFESRDQYRHELEYLAKNTHTSDIDVAKLVVALARQTPSAEVQGNQHAHVGYWLLSDGRPHLEQRLGYRLPAARWLRHTLRQHPHMAYFGGLGALTVAAVAAMSVALVSWNIALLSALIIVALWIIPLSETAQAIVNLVITNVLPPRLLPRLDFRNGIPRRFPTVVVVPSMLSSAREVESLLQRLESHYLANSDAALSFALLTDFVDADSKVLPEDRELIEEALAGIRLLNARYGQADHQPFYFFHRSRRWNDAEYKWMGWERKRGKLMEFGRWLQGHQDTSYSVIEGNLDALAQLRRAEVTPFVITLDSDTQLPFEAARKMIGTLAHPLNRPQFASVDAKGSAASDDQNVQAFETDRVVSGYTILQPRVSVQLESASKSLYANLFSGSPGVDPYVTAASDVYQDLFGEGSFTGKGIYDLHAFERALSDAFPENSILSHDLIEGCHARVGLVSNIEVFDAFPSRYDVDARRHHRWVRGDWQLLPWLMPRVPYAEGWKPNPLSWLSWWKVADNLRRSLVAPLLIAAMVCSCLLAPQLAGLWSLTTLAILFFPALTTLLMAVRNWPKKLDVREHLAVMVADFQRALLQCGFSAAVLPHKAVVMMDAIGRTLWRMTISRKRMLQWQTASAVEQQLSGTKRNWLMQYWYLPGLTLTLLALLPTSTLLWASPLLVLWFVGAWLIELTNRPIVTKQRQLDDQQNKILFDRASETWSFFEAYVTADDNWLPVDNVQEEPQEKVAHRLSPTNEGLFLVSALIAHDFGFIGLPQLVDSWNSNLDSVDRLEKLHGHLYNWYDTQTLEPLHPRYVSTVDSGNLMACLLTVHQGIAELVDNYRPQPQRYLRGVASALDLLDNAGSQLNSEDPDEVSTFVAQIREISHVLRSRLASTNQDVVELWSQWFGIQSDLAILSERLSTPISWKLTRRTADRLRRMANKISIAGRRIEGLIVEYKSLHGWIPFAGTRADPLSRHASWEGLSLKQLADLPSQPVAACIHVSEQFGIEVADSDLAAMGSALVTSGEAARRIGKQLERLAIRVESLALGMDFRFLYNPQRKLFAIGFNIEDGLLDRSHYDMLCSESRLSSYLAIAKGDVESLHWFRLGRHATLVKGQFALLSWGGTMFEYLMPPLFQRQYEGSMLTQSCQAAVKRQADYGRQNRVPWGISESAFGALAINADYHYRSFGVPGLGLKRGLAKDLVISPYSTVMALTVDPQLAFANLEALIKEGALGHFGYYEAVDYTAERVPANKRRLIVRCYMAHHQGMSLVALANLLNDHCIQRRFTSHPIPRAAELLLQERIPQAITPFKPHAEEAEFSQPHVDSQSLTSRRLVGVESPSPRTHLLSNGNYSVMLSSAGGGYSRAGDMDVTRWRSDTTLDYWGQYVYIRDKASDQVWSATYQPTRVMPDFYEVLFAIDKVDFHRRQGDIETVLEVAISPESNAEVRQLRITNHGTEARTLELTSYAEVCLAKQAADAAHPAFQKLFIETEYIKDETALIARRRPRDQAEPAQYAVHVLATPTEGVSNIQFDSSRDHFIGRRRNLELPQAITQDHLSETVGAVLDPVFALRCQVEVPASSSISIAWSTAVAESRSEALALADQYHELRNVQRVFELAWAYAQVELRHQHLGPAQVHLYQRLSAYLLYPHWSMRGESELIKQNRLGQSSLWRHGISGDLPILVARITEPEHISLVRELALAQRFWRQRGFMTDLVLINDYPGSYYDALQDQVANVLRDIYRSPDFPGVYVLRGSQLPTEEVALLHSVAACVLEGDEGSVAQQLDAAQARAQLRAVELSELRATGPQSTRPPLAGQWPSDGQTLEFYNGYGGFDKDGSHYCIHVRPDRVPPAPWSQVVANPRLGFMVTESGGGFTWFENSRENKLTPWCNDPTSDPPSELLAIRDDASGEVIMPMTFRPDDPHCNQPLNVTYGAGFATFDRKFENLTTRVELAVAETDPLKFIRLTITNHSRLRRNLTINYFVDLVLGVSRESSAWHLQTDFDAQHQALLCRNPYHPEYAQQVVFAKTLSTTTSFTTDRLEVLGRMGNTYAPAAVQSERLSGRVGIDLDPCFGLRTVAQIEPGQTQEIVFLLGAGRDLSEAEQLLNKYDRASATGEAIKTALAAWQTTLSAIQVKTPNRGMDILVNHWLIYQVLCCRIWGRSAFYQSGGAFGFRDQLQDSMAIVYSRPEITRQQILLAASRQFKQGDVQHWWHPPLGKGTRTRFSDDLLWLPLVVCHYVDVTGDASILDENITFLESPELQPGEMERYELPRVSNESGSLLEHCLRAIDHGLRFGQHGLPLMGCGDWNDGMNKVGEGGQGESVWVGWFLLVILDRFVPVLRERGLEERANNLSTTGDQLRSALETQAWDGQWYRRAFFDDGSPLGSSTSDDCQIDSLTQTWAVLAGGDHVRCQQAMAWAMTRLVRTDERIILLFTPAFDHGEKDPGYIKGYLPGIRENGGQYTHAATWMVQALARLGQHSAAMNVWDMINPISHTFNPHGVDIYKTEPYVVAADVYNAAGHVGRGGWTWYTGSAAWLYRVAIEDLLGLKIRNGQATVEPGLQEDEVKVTTNFTWTNATSRTGGHSN